MSERERTPVSQDVALPAEGITKLIALNDNCEQHKVFELRSQIQPCGAVRGIALVGPPSSAALARHAVVLPSIVQRRFTPAIRHRLHKDNLANQVPWVSRFRPPLPWSPLYLYPWMTRWGKAKRLVRCGFGAGADADFTTRSTSEAGHLYAGVSLFDYVSRHPESATISVDAPRPQCNRQLVWVVTATSHPYLAGMAEIFVGNCT
ncbi:hypothetical protein BJV78DRAFT_1301831 [Lactifluus subvellereus]|nr:hypothetical protein BJV78DRAFT_1301831 [Lactifluus subvellereus]